MTSSQRITKKGLQKVYCHIKKQTLYMVFHCHINMYIYVQLFTVKSSIKRIHKRWNSGGNNWETAKIAKASNVRHTSDAAISNISQSPPPPRPSLWASSIEILLHIYTFTRTYNTIWAGSSYMENSCYDETTLKALLSFMCYMAKGARGQ